MSVSVDETTWLEQRVSNQETIITGLRAEISRRGELLNKLDRLETWATFAAEALQEVIDDAQQGVGDPDGEAEQPVLRALLKDLDGILMPEVVDDGDQYRIAP